MERNSSLPLRYWGLEHWPFRGSSDAAQFYPSAGHNEALARIEHLVDSRLRMGALLGETGAGKTVLLCETAKRAAQRRSSVVRVDAIAISPREFLWQIAIGLGTAPRDDADTSWMWREIGDRLKENRLRQVSTVLLVDDCGQAGADVLTQIERLARIDLAPTTGWTIVLAAEPGQGARWASGVRGLVDLRIDVLPWEEDDTVGFLQTSLVDAGRFEPAFDDAALRLLHELSRGVPRQVVRVAEFALVAGAAAELELINAATIDAAYQEIAWPAQFAGIDRSR